MEKLKIDDIFIGVKNKIKIYNEIKDKYELDDNNICFLGDDIQDLEILKKVTGEDFGMDSTVWLNWWENRNQ